MGHLLIGSLLIVLGMAKSPARAERVAFPETNVTIFSNWSLGGPPYLSEQSHTQTAPDAKQPHTETTSDGKQPHAETTSDGWCICTLASHLRYNTSIGLRVKTNIASRNNTSTNSSKSGSSTTGTLSTLVHKEHGDCWQNLSADEGRIDWTGDGGGIMCLWQIEVMGEVEKGLVLQFDTVALHRGPQEAADDTVTVFIGTQPDPSKELTRVQGSLPVPPILVPSDRVLLRLQSYDDSDTSHQHPSSFALSFQAYPLHVLPPRVAPGMVRSYNCSPPYRVPQALRCDMVQQCVGGEDEMNYNCSYRKKPCGDWIPLEHRNLCFLFIAQTNNYNAETAKRTCRQRPPYGRLAELTDPELKQFVAEIVARNGYQDALVGLKRISSQRAFRDERFFRFQYRFLWSWEESRYLELESTLLFSALAPFNCAVLRVVPAVHLRPVSCIERVQAFVCMKGMTDRANFTLEMKGPRSQFRPVNFDAQGTENIECSDGSFTHLIYGCTPPLRIIGEPMHVPGMHKLFPCAAGDSVLYNEICNGQVECNDDSDEEDCDVVQYRVILFFEQYIECKDKTKVVKTEYFCDGQYDCSDNSDEEFCTSCVDQMTPHELYGCIPEKDYYKELSHTFNVNVQQDSSIFISDTDLRQVIAADSRMKRARRILHTYLGFAIIRPWEGDCPDTHYLCHAGLCIPGYLVENDIIRDCPIYGNDDEGDLSTEEFLVCSGYFRCYSSECLHPEYVCDGVNHCPNNEDEFFCSDCPSHCVCLTFQYKCQQMFQVRDDDIFVKYLDLSHVFRPNIEPIRKLVFIHFLNLSFCQLKELKGMGITRVLTVLDLSFNQIKRIPNIWISSQKLRFLNLSNNPLESVLQTDSFMHVRNMHDTKSNSITWLSLRNTGLHIIQGGVFTNFSRLQLLDIRDNSIRRFQKNMFTGLIALQSLIAHDPRVCCVYSFQYSGINALVCQVPEDELSSCEDLLHSGFLRVALWLQSLMAVVGNLGVFVLRVFLEFHKTPTSFRVLVINLCVADLFMGFYMTIIGAADAHFMGQYVWKQDTWTGSVLCKMAGCLALMCSEMSAFIICIVTVDRLLVLRFPFKAHWHLTARSAKVVCGAAWGVALVVAVVPLLPVTQHWNFYGQTGICLPLPITRRQFPGATYSFAIFIVLNFVLFLLISLGQLFNFITIHNTPTAGRTDRHQQDMTIARRLFLIVFTDFCCWFPVGIMGLLAARGTSIPGQVNVWTAVLVLPINSVLNPLLYTLNVLREKKKKRVKAKWMKHMLQKLRVDMSSWPRETVIQVYRCCESALKNFPSAEDSQPRSGRTDQSLLRANAVHSPVQGLSDS